MMIPVHGRGLWDLVRVVLNPRLLMVYALAGGAALRGLRQRRWRARRAERRKAGEAVRRRVFEAEDEGKEGGDEE